MLLRINNNEYEYKNKMSLEEISKDFCSEDKPMIVAACVDNELVELSEIIDKNCEIEWVDLKSSDGIRIYQRTLSFIFIRATMELYRGIEVVIRHSLSKGLYCDFRYDRDLSEKDINSIKDRMNEIIASNEIIKKEVVKRDEARQIFENLEFNAKAEILKYRDSDQINIYSCGWIKNYFYGYMLPNVSYVKYFNLIKYDKGVILAHPTSEVPMGLPEFEEHKKIAQIFRESEEWGEIVSVGNVSSLNKAIEENKYKELMILGEALHEKKIAKISDIITKENKRIILIAGPSSSGKTTLANRLRIQLKVNRLDPITISTDDYFVDREFTPLDENGDYDFETIKAVDVELFNKHLTQLLNGEEVEMPEFNFIEGKKEYNGRVLKITKEQPIIIEGIHGLNEILTKDIPKEVKYKIYISALTQLNIDDHNRIPTTDSRLIRRMVRDSKFRGHSAKRTIELWSSVRRGEERNIFPFQEEADIVFNSALSYELSLLKKHAMPILREVDKNSKEYKEAKRLMKFLSYFEDIEDDSLVPVTSILKEFIGGSYFTDNEGKK